ncbi:unnamed protein product (macronuclear) [Paramecium tetraurelia]|uniref:Uncharacterized protein n=1 Tax=Paramecium tetraurelia TaxID=5888 RepID=A0E466_PARTE|nr:uncharacterized protein GSPATT00023257001 [Paramecium tetraurelia]CAK90083.1 unnamed protein product [Paramecium tetraurelia]|eukprot:XP_001457480.1 hypothetical protein (macronuclear) [Paramecium tetraurelia strain d4-2]
MIEYLNPLIPDQTLNLNIDFLQLYSIPQERPLGLNLAGQVVAEISPFVQNIQLLFKEKQEQYKLAKIQYSELQNSLQELQENKINEKNKYDLLLQDSNHLLQQKQQEINQLYYTQSKIKKDQEELQKEFKQQNDDFKLENANLIEVIKQKKRYLFKLSNNRHSRFQILLLFLKFIKTLIVKYHNTESYIIIRVYFIHVQVIKQSLIKVLQNLTMVGVGARDIISKSGYSNIQDPGRGQRITLQIY